MFLRSQILWKSNEFPVWKVSSRKTNIYIYTHTHITIYAHLCMGTYMHISYIYIYLRILKILEICCTDFKFSSWKPRTAGGDWGRSRLVKSIDNSPRPSFLKSIGFWLLVQTGIELAEDADTGIPRRNCQSNEVADLPLFKAHKNGIIFL